MVPCVLFAYNRPDKFARVVSAMRTQNVDRIVVFIDGPRDRSIAGKVKECRRIAKGIDWVSVDYVFKERNEGLAGIINNIGAVFRSYDSAVFVEDDCLPMPAFYSFMKRALRHYADDTRVFSVGGYQQISGDFFKSFPYSFVSSARFMCWGWASWRNRWESIAPCLSKDRADIADYCNIPDTAGDDLPLFARRFSRGARRLWETSSWDIRVAILSLYFEKVHLLTTRGLIKNIGLDAGVHFKAYESDKGFYNRNVYEGEIANIRWLRDTRLHDEYNKRLKASVDSTRNYFLEKIGRTSAKRQPRYVGRDNRKSSLRPESHEKRSPANN